MKEEHIANKHLTYEEREYIEIGLTKGRNFAEIAKDLNKNRTTVMRELQKHRLKKCLKDLIEEKVFIKKGTNVKSMIVVKKKYAIKKKYDIIPLEKKDMNKEEIIKYCLSLEDTYKDCPFTDDFESVTMKHKKNKKWFALIMNVHNKLYLNVKTDPDYSDILRSSYGYIIPAYHMNKEHWNTIIIDKNVDETLVKELIEQSYELTK